jgi:hypothetical protein
MAAPTPPPLPRPGGGWATVLRVVGALYVALGIVLLAAFLLGGVRSSLFPTGWLFPAVLLGSGALMAARRRADVVLTLWAGLGLVVFMLDVLVYMNALDRGLDDAAVFDGAIIVAALGLVALLLRPAFRD